MVQICSLVNEIFHTQTKKSQTAQKTEPYTVQLKPCLVTFWVYSYSPRVCMGHQHTVVSTCDWIAEVMFLNAGNTYIVDGQKLVV